MTLAQKSDRILAQTRGLSGATPNATQLIEELRWALEAYRQENARLTAERDEIQRELRRAETESSMLRVECGVIAKERDEAGGKVSDKQDIVDRLHNILLHEKDGLALTWLATCAANEIERLRAERDERKAAAMRTGDKQDLVTRLRLFDYPIEREAATEIDRLQGSVAMLRSMFDKAVKGREDAKMRISRILNEIDCRVQHGADSNGHLEAILALFKDEDK